MIRFRTLSTSCEVIKTCLKSTKHFYKVLLEKVATKNVKAAAKWQSDLNLEENENWNQHFISLYRGLIMKLWAIIHYFYRVQCKMFGGVLARAASCFFFQAVMYAKSE